jgi:hypothetical protein
VAIAVGRLALDLSALPWHAERFGVGFYLGHGNKGKPLLLVAPGLGNAVVPHVRYAASLVLRLAGGLVAKDHGTLAYRASLLDLMESLALDSRMHLR